MKKCRKQIVIAVLLLFIMSVAVIIISESVKDDAANAAVVLADGTIEVPPGTDAKNRGTEDNPFVVLEIVPYEGLAEFGYMVAGQEPVDFKAAMIKAEIAELIKSTNQIYSIKPQGGDSNGPWYSFEYDQYLADNLGSDYRALDWGENLLETWHGYFIHVSDGSGDYNQINVVMDETNKITSAEYKKVSEGEKGDFKWYGCDYYNNKSYGVTDHNAEIINYSLEKQLVYRGYYYKLGNYNNFLIEGIGLKYKKDKNGEYIKSVNGKFEVDTPEIIAEKVKNYHVKVITVTPEDLNLPKNHALIDRADLIYITNAEHIGRLVEFTESNLNKELFSHNETDNKTVATKAATHLGGSKYTFEKNDLTWETTVKILEKISIAENRCPLWYDNAGFNLEYYSASNQKDVYAKKYCKDGTEVILDKSKTVMNNVYKLGMIIHMTEPVQFYNTFIKTNRIVSYKTEGNNVRKYGVPMTTGQLVEMKGKSLVAGVDASLYWIPRFFMPYELYTKAQVDSDWAVFYEQGWNVNPGSGEIIVNGYVYTYKTDNSPLQFSNKPYVYYGDDLKYGGEKSFTNVAYEFYYDTLEEMKKSENVLTPLEVIHYLLKAAQEQRVTRDLTVLEIEPYADYMTDAQWDDYFKNYIPDYLGKLNIVRMTSSEFIGKIDDLNSAYDIIYFGDRKDDTDLSKADLPGRVYRHIGDKVNISKGDSGWFEYDSQETRYSGNDITKVKMAAVINFVEAGYPVMIAESFVKNGNSNTDILDASSYMYELVKVLLSNDADGYNYKANTFYKGNINKDRFKKLVINPKCEIVYTGPGTGKPVEYKDRSLPENKNIDKKDIYINGYSSTMLTLTYSFKIVDTKPGTKYSVNLYIDTNADGKFDVERENLDNLTITDITTGKNNISPSELLSGHEYKIERKLLDYVGILPWKLEIVQNNNKNIRDIKTGYSAIEVSESKKEKITALQIISNEQYFPSVIFATDDEIKEATKNAKKDGIIDLKKVDFSGNIKVSYSENKNTVTISDNRAKVTKLFWQYTNDLNDFEISFERMSVHEFEKNAKNDPTFINKYHMLIFGFSDMYTTINNDETYRVINDYIAQGKAVLFTHDFISFDPNIKNSIKLRDLIGMDRFGATLAATYRTEKDKAYLPGTYQSEDKTIPIDPKNNNNKNKNIEIQGFTSHYLDRYRKSGGTGSPAYTTKASQVNEGQLTEYPYKISKELSVTNTHEQYYQLDFESDDITVWYCLADDKGKYSKSPNDVRNSYYIYNRGNITYTGVGHMPNGEAGGFDMGEMEVKLFVNTIVAAYRASAAPATARITNKDKSTDGIKDFLYINYDSTNDKLPVGEEIKIVNGIQYKKVYFRLHDQSVVTNKKLDVEFYSDDITKAASEAEKIDLKIYTVGHEEKDTNIIRYNEFKAGIEYYTYLPIDKLNNKDSVNYTIKVTVTYGKASDNTMSNIQILKIIRRGLFNIS